MKTEVQNAFAIAQYSEVMNIEKFSKHISTHGCVYSRTDISTGSGGNTDSGGSKEFE